MKSKFKRPNQKGILENRMLFLIPTLGVLATLAGLQIYHNFQNSLPLTYHAEKIFHAMDHEDVGVLLKYTRKEEISQTGLDKQSLLGLVRWQKSLWNTIPGNSGDVKCEDLGANTASVQCHRLLESGSISTPVSIGITITKSDEGPVCGVTSSLLKAGLYAKYAPHNAEVNALEKSWTAIALGLDAEIDTLKKMGIKGVVETDSKASFISLDQLHSAAKATVAKLAQMRESGIASTELVSD